MLLLLSLLFILQLICSAGVHESGKILRPAKLLRLHDYQFLCPRLSVSNLHYQLVAQVCVVDTAHLSARLISEQSVCRPGGRVSFN